MTNAGFAMLSLFIAMLRLNESAFWAISWNQLSKGSDDSDFQLGANRLRTAEAGMQLTYGILIWAFYAVKVVYILGRKIWKSKS